MDFVVIDFETANEKRNSACAVGLTKVRNGVVCETVHRLIRPLELRFSNWNTRIHGITLQDVVDCPTIEQLWPELAGYVQDELVVAHNASFDISVLRHSLHAVAIPIPRISYLCSLQLSRMLWPQLTSHSLGFLAVVHKIQLEHHNAGSDSLATAKLVLLGGHENGLSCPRELAAHCECTIGELYSEDEWIPSSSPGIHQDRETIEITVPDDFDITTHPFYQKSIVFTGTLMMSNRNEAERIVEKFGGSAKKSVSTKTDYLVTGIQDVRMLACGTNASSKLREAMGLRERGYQIKVISECDFAELVFNPMNSNIK